MIKMCGVAGIISKESVNISAYITNMLSLIQHRGPDAAGVAIFDDSQYMILRVTLKQESALLKLKQYVESFGKILKESKVINVAGKLCYEMAVDVKEEDEQKLHELINSDENLDVHSISRHFKVYKEGGHIDNLLGNYDFKDSFCRLGIGHVRMATESAEDVNAAHPFVSPFWPELAIVHNGQFTNYFNLRRFLESKGAKFKTLNDSEAASHLIAYGMKIYNGDLKKALDYAGDYMDGVFCVIAATPKQMGCVKDKLGIKPLLMAETKNMVMLASEQIEFTAIDDSIYADELEPGEVRVWDI